MKNHAFDVAIIGMDGRFPGAADIQALWENVSNGVESVTRIDRDVLLAAGVREDEMDHPDYVPYAAMLDDYDCFDAAFFNTSPAEARKMDPQQRLLLQCGWRTLEDAGYAPGRTAQRVGVFVGSGGLVTNALWAHADVRHEFVGKTGGGWHVGHDKDFVPTRLSYKLDLTGPSVCIQTACSTSLVAVHTACSSLLRGECEMALAGASNVRVPHVSGYRYEKNNIYSKDGHVRPFDALASGVVFGSGVGLVLLKPLEQALADRDAIYAVIKGSAVNNDGGDKMSFLSSKVRGQAECMRMALKDAAVEPGTISYVEAHGTGTLVGDPLETQALAQVFGQHLSEDVLSRQRGIKIGSIKGNIGHLDTAAGIAGLIKVTLSLKHRSLPASINCTTLNPKIDLGDGDLEVCTSTSPWECNGAARRAGINCLGIGGTNAFAVLEEAPAPDSTGIGDRDASWHLITLSAKSKSALREGVRDLQRWLLSHPAIDLPDLAACLYFGRVHFSERCAFVVSGTDNLSEQLGRFLAQDDDQSSSVAGQCDNHSPLVIRMAMDAVRGGASGDELRECLDVLMRAYRDGSGEDLGCLFRPEFNKLHLPGYHFDKTRF